MSEHDLLASEQERGGPPLGLGGVLRTPCHLVPPDSAPATRRPPKLGALTLSADRPVEQDGRARRAPLLSSLPSVGLGSGSVATVRTGVLVGGALCNPCLALGSVDPEAEEIVAVKLFKNTQTIYPAHGATPAQLASSYQGHLYSLYPEVLFLFLFSDGK